MKLKLCFLLLLCPIFPALAQGQNIKIGDEVPNVTITNVTGLQIGGKDVTAFKLSALRGKLVIIDFWATWCSPCRAMVPKMDSLEKVFGGHVQFLPVSYESSAVVKPVLAAMKKQRDFNLPEVTSDTALGRLFPHVSLPHYVWIDGSGILRAITEAKAVTAANIRKMLDGGSALAEKRDTIVEYNPAKPLLAGGNGGDGSALKYHSLLTRFMPGLAGGIHISPYDSVSGQTFSARNVPLIWLCRLAYGEQGRWFSNARVLLLTRDSSVMVTGLTGQEFDSWLAAGHGYCYELVLPPAIAGRGFTFIQEDLRRLFPQYAVTVEQRKQRCLALVRTSAADKLKSPGGGTLVNISPFACELRNSHLSQFLMRLDRQYLQKYPLPVVDLTGYADRVDLSFEAKLSDVASLNAGLSKYDLQLREQDAVVEMLVIRDAPVIN